MTKRKAEFDLNRDEIIKGDFEYAESQKKNLNQNIGTIQTPEEIAQRRILKIKNIKTDSLTPQKEQKFVLSQTLNVEVKHSEEIPAFHKSEHEKEIKEPKQFIEKAKEIPSPLGKKSPFENLLKAEIPIKNESPKKGMFGFLMQQVQMESQQPKTTENGSRSKGLFDNIPPKQNENKNEEKLKSLFGEQTSPPNNVNLSLFTNNGTTFANISSGSSSLFNNPATSIFGAPSSNLFTNNSNVPKATNGNGGIFGNLGSGSIFGNNGNNNQNSAFGQSLFAGAAKNENNNSDGDDDGNDNEDPEGSKSPEVDQSKSSGNFQYSETFEKLISKNIHKFKTNDKDAFEGGFLSIEKQKEKNSYIVIYRNQAKLILYQGWLLPKLSQVGTLNKRPDSMTLILFNEKTKDGKAKLEKDLLKIMFVSQPDCEQFKKKLEELAN